MANHKSAAKRARQNVKKKLRNHSYFAMVKSTLKSFRKSLEEFGTGQGNPETSKALWSKAQSALHKAASKGIIHHHNASRKISRLGREFERTVNGAKPS